LPKNDLVKNYRVHPTHWLIYPQVAGMYAAVEDCVRDERNRQQALQDEMEGTLEARYGMDPAQFSGVKVAPPELTEI